MEQNFQIVVANVGKPRRETLNGRDFLVAPATLIVGDAVLNGSQGALLYPSQENERDPQAWNGMPLVAWHPVKVINGVKQHVSARNPEILNEWGLGHFYHANSLESHVDGNLDGEAWFDVENVKAVDAKLVKRGVDPILPRLQGGQQIELSTGLFTKNVQAEAMARNAKGDSYTGIATNYRPDHVAILPDEVGACSVDHGCGVNNQQGIFKSVINAVAKALGINSSLVRPEQPVEDEPSGGDCCAGKRPDQMCEECKAKVTTNAWTDDDFEAVLNARMCWGHPCDSNSAPAGTAHRDALEHKIKAADAQEAATAATKKSGWGMGKAARHADNAIKRASKGDYEGAAKAHASAAKSLKKFPGGQEERAAHVAASRAFASVAQYKAKGFLTNKGERYMPLTKIQRTKMVQQLTTNCACKIKPAVLNEMDDDALEQTANAHNLILVVNTLKKGKLPKVVVNAEGEGEAVPGVPWVKLADILGIETDPRSDPVAFAAELKNALNGIVSKLGGDAAPPPTDEPTPGDAPTVSADTEPEPDEDDDMTGNRRAPQPQLTREQREDLAFAANMKREHKVGLVRRLLEHVPLANRKARGDKLFKLSIAELEDRIADLPVENERQVQQPQIDWSLAGGGGRQTLNSEDQETDAATVELMTNADEEYRQMILKAKTA